MGVQTVLLGCRWSCQDVGDPVGVQTVLSEYRWPCGVQGDAAGTGSPDTHRASPQPPAHQPCQSPALAPCIPALPAWPGAPQVCALGANSSRDEQGPPRTLLAVYPDPELQRCRAAPAEFAQGYDVQRAGNEREYFAFEKERNKPC